MQTVYETCVCASKQQLLKLLEKHHNLHQDECIKAGKNNITNVAIIPVLLGQCQLRHP